MTKMDISHTHTRAVIPKRLWRWNWNKAFHICSYLPAYKLKLCCVVVWSCVCHLYSLSYHLRQDYFPATLACQKILDSVCVKFEVFTALLLLLLLFVLLMIMMLLLLRVQVFSDIILCQWVIGYQYSERLQCFQNLREYPVTECHSQEDLNIKYNLFYCMEKKEIREEEGGVY